MQRIGILHPGAMGISVAASALHTGQRVAWASAGRSAASRERAAQHGLEDCGGVAQLCAESTMIISVCPPDAAESVAHEVIAAGFRGLYLDANAIAPARAVRIGAALHEAGIDVVDGGIIGGPAWQPGTTWLYLSGPRAAEAATCFAAGPLETDVLGDELGAASALKMCYAAYTKGSTALLSASLASADALHVREALVKQWARETPSSADANINRVRQVTAKAWRFAGEMDEIAATFRAAGLPGEFHDAAAEIYRRLAAFKDATNTPPIDDVLAALEQRTP